MMAIVEAKKQGWTFQAHPGESYAGGELTPTQHRATATKTSFSFLGEVEQGELPSGA